MTGVNAAIAVYGNHLAASSFEVLGTYEDEI
jgi:hypothetical protein